MTTCDGSAPNNSPVYWEHVLLTPNGLGIVSSGGWRRVGKRGIRQRASALAVHETHLGASNHHPAWAKPHHRIRASAGGAWTSLAFFTHHREPTLCLKGTPFLHLVPPTMSPWGIGPELWSEQVCWTPQPRTPPWSPRDLPRNPGSTLCPRLHSKLWPRSPPLPQPPVVSFSYLVFCFDVQGIKGQ